MSARPFYSLLLIDIFLAIDPCCKQPKNNPDNNNAYCIRWNTLVSLVAHTLISASGFTPLVFQK